MNVLFVAVTRVHIAV